MVKATHYDVYADYGSGWSMEQRFSEENRLAAYALVKEKEAVKIPVKVVCEIFDEVENNYSETIEYVSGLSVRQAAASRRSKDDYDFKADNAKNVIKAEDSTEPDSITKEVIFKAIIKIFIIIAIGIFLTNLLVSLFYPLIEYIVPPEKVKASMFLVFFILFMIITIPLLLTKVPWDVFLFSEKKGKSKEKLDEKNLVNRALEILSVYDLNTEQFPVAPVARNVSFEDKQESIAFLSYVLSVVDPEVLSDSFLKLGLRFVLYGACIELAKHRGLSFAQANALLYEVFGVIDGERNVNLEEFYEAKVAYKDIDVAVLMAGIGAYIMHNMLLGKILKENYLNMCFAKWEYLKNPELSENDSYETEEHQKPEAECIVSIKSMIKFEDNEEAQNEIEKAALEQKRSDVRKIIFDAIYRYGGGKVVEEGSVASISFSKIDFALNFVVNVLQDILSYQSDVNERFMFFYNTCNLVVRGEQEDLPKYIDDIFVYNFNNEIVFSPKAYDMVDKNLYGFENMGIKHLDSLDLDVELYKLIY